MAYATGQNPPFQGIVVYDMSRFSRSPAERKECEAKLQANGIELISVTQRSYSPTQLAPTKQQAVKEFYQKQLSDSTKRDLRHRASRGHFVSSKAPYGYKKVAVRDGYQQHYTLELGPETAPTVRRIYDLALNGSSDRDTARDLNHDQVPYLNGRQLTAQDVKKIRQNEVNCGTYVYGKNDTDNQIRVENVFPTIVSREEFNRAQ